MSLANAFAAELAQRLSNISTANGYATDIGLRTFRGRRRLDAQQLPCAVVIERPDEPVSQNGSKVKTLRKYVLEGHAKCDPDNPNDVGHDLLSDIKRAVFAGAIGIDARLSAGNVKSYSLTYSGSSIAPRDDGLDVVSASVEVALEFVEDLSNP